MLSGAHFHQHWSAWNCIAYGRKRWAIMPPSANYVNPTTTSLQWWRDVRPKVVHQWPARAVPPLAPCYPAMCSPPCCARRAAYPATLPAPCYPRRSAAVAQLLEQGFRHLFECDQEPGDLLFVPSGWWHSILNLMDTVSIAVQVGAPTSWGEHFGGTT